MKSERLFEALSYIGDDLLMKAETARFGPNPWRKWASLAATLALVLCLTTLALPFFPIGCGASGKSEAPAAEEAPAAAENIMDMTTDDGTGQETAEEESAPATEEKPAEEAPAEEEQKPVEVVSFTFEGKTYEFLGRADIPADLGDPIGRPDTWDGRDLSTAQLYEAHYNNLYVLLPTEHECYLATPIE